ncbi:hypothetical protein ANME2D_00198 [Candidatus Methanoperedens nitroreducens]|uniref:Uncharacterized protein n=1 Tax=Candidatus Methanoperedens nitratireducens TaxID=1392998 RepID=A0A062VBR1_9EURY|nr:hypothetical protein [Candidatus Methanoperedens nitroreducens]KCZ73139.1 hypothetical protein ANME2D_00198 [Candidatus Methanoperedens nitroreducens]MDJ1422912.1 hypothetical protein [Candidatus Methanoperedens sp.]
MNEGFIEVNFPKLNHFWMDSGLLGLYRIANDENPEEMGVEIELNDNGVLFKGTESNLDKFFHKTYKSLLSQYYNTSTDKQKRENAGFYYDSKADKFVRFPKVKSMGIAGLIFNKAPRYTKDEVKYEKKEVIESGKKIKKEILPIDYAHLQERLDKFLVENNLKIGSSSLLIDGPNAIQPKVEINFKKGKPKGKCFICGDYSHSLSEIGGTVFPMISGSSGALSFNSAGGRPEKVCWKCDFIGKFVPVNGFYTISNDSYHIYFPYSSSLEKMNDIFSSLRAIKIEDQNLLRNFKHNLGGYFQKPFEQLFAFLYSLYRIVMIRKTSKGSTDEDYELDYEKLFDITLCKAPIEFFVMYTEALGDTQMGKMIWPFQDSVYLFRLLDRLERNKISINDTMTLLIEFDQPKNESKTIVRNRICERILRKQSIVELVEQHVYRINKSKIQYIRQLNDFVILYEKILNEDGGKMNQEIIDTAVSLGKTIGKSVGPSGKKGKGDLFRLRKTRKQEDFLNEINRIQIKHGALVTADLYNKGQAIGDNFAEFKQFCMIAALNTFNAENRKEQNTDTNIKIKEEKQ